MAARGRALPMHTSPMPRAFAASHWRHIRSGNMTRPSATPTVTSAQAKAKVSDAIREFKVGDAKDRGNTWMVSIKYNDKVIMTVLLGKLNTPTSKDAVTTVQGSMNGWKTGEPKQLQLVYNVPIMDANGNTVGNVRVDGRSGNIATGFPQLGR